MQNGVRLVISIAICLLVGFIAGRFTSSEIGTWYTTLHKPAWNPPNWIFFPVWTTLYVMMGVALFLVWRKGDEGRGKSVALTFFGIQLFLNFMWSLIFFRFHAIGWAFAEIVLLWMAIMVTMVRFFPLSRAATWLLIPYLCWVTFAAFLNYTIMTLNT